MPEIWFWQRIVTPHMAGLAGALARQGVQTVYVAEQAMTNDRAAQGWQPHHLTGVRLELAPTAAEMSGLAGAAPGDSIHICQGLRANGPIGAAQRRLAARSLRQWAALETLDDDGWRGLVRRLEYRRLFAKWQPQLAGVLAIGHRTPEWITNRGMSPNRVFQFAYFLPQEIGPIEQIQGAAGRYRFVFVGQFIERKRLDLLISALAATRRTDVELAVVGSGPMEEDLRRAAEGALLGRVDWIGRLPMRDVQKVVAESDCLVLPSRHDGWGAVVSEALMVGTPVICSDRCGSAWVARASGHGEVFRSGSVADLREALARSVEKGRLSIDQRSALANWAQCLGASAGAKYLQAILAYSDGRGDMPHAPWDDCASGAWMRRALQ